VGAQAAFIEPGSPWENGYCESFNSKLDTSKNRHPRYVLCTQSGYAPPCVTPRHRQDVRINRGKSTHGNQNIVANNRPTSPVGDSVAAT
jgi:hypothetical protein